MAFLTDYTCFGCGNNWEELLLNRYEAVAACPQCSSLEIMKVIGGTITKLHDKEVRQASLKKRSEDHSLREAKKAASYKGNLPSTFGLKNSGG